MGLNFKMAQEGYCCKCKKKQSMKNIVKKTLGGRKQVKRPNARFAGLT